jgi:hypothetical protein
MWKDLRFGVLVYEVEYFPTAFLRHIKIRQQFFCEALLFCTLREFV